MQAYLSMGSNIGDRALMLREAAWNLAAHPDIRILAESSIYETEPWGLKEQPEYWNQVLEIETNLEPMALLKVCQGIENSLGRERIIRWGPRTIDIDILIYDNMISDTPELILPHPRMEERAFVLIPLREIAPGMILPSGRSIQEVNGEGQVKPIA